MKKLPIIATGFLGLGVIMFGIMILQSEEETATLDDAVGQAIVLIGDAFMISLCVLVCMVLSIISICDRHSRTWSYAMLILCLAWFAWLVLIATG